LKHIKQAQAFWDNTRFKFLLVGRRGGKTHMIVEHMIKTIMEAEHGGKVFYIGPTLQQAYELIWETLDDRLTELGVKYTPLVSKRRFEFPGKRYIYCLGAERIRRIRGHSADAVYMDELAFFEQDLGAIWRAVRPTLTDRAGVAICSTTPNGKATQAYDFYIEAINKPEWKVFKWASVDNPFMNREEIEAARREMDEKSFRQEYLATWESFAGLTYYNFDEDKHLKRCSEIDSDKPLILCFDFNVNPSTLLLQQDLVRDHLSILQFKKEYSLKNSSTLDTVRLFCQDHKDLAGNVRLKIRGDSTGRNRSSVTGLADYKYIQDELTHAGFSFEMEVAAKNPAIVDRINHVNAYLQNCEGESRIEIDPSCKDLIRDLSSQELAEGTRMPSDKGNLGHKADAFGYSVYWDHIDHSRKKSGTIIL
jgi:PBSX family phage terminase large subunit